MWWGLLTSLGVVSSLPLSFFICTRVNEPNEALRWTGYVIHELYSIFFNLYRCGCLCKFKSAIQINSEHPSCIKGVRTITPTQFQLIKKANPAERPSLRMTSHKYSYHCQLPPRPWYCVLILRRSKVHVIFERTSKWVKNQKNQKQFCIRQFLCK